jgi:hypothetical protein
MTFQIFKDCVWFVTPMNIKVKKLAQMSNTESVEKRGENKV